MNNDNAAKDIALFGGKNGKSCAYNQFLVYSKQSSTEASNACRDHYKYV
jgi:hypothetical protein